MTSNKKITLLLNGDSRFDEIKNKIVLKSSMKHIKTTERFSGPLFEKDFINFPMVWLIFSLIYPDSFNFYFLIFTTLICETICEPLGNGDIGARKAKKFLTIFYDVYVYMNVCMYVCMYVCMCG